MKKWLSILIAAVLVMSMAVPALATQHADNNFTLPTTQGTVLQNQTDRNIQPKTPADRNPIIPGESPTTGLSWIGFYLPMLAQYSNGVGTLKVNGTKVKAAGIGPRAPWGGQYADVVYEGILYRDGATRMTFVFSDSLTEGYPTSFGAHPFSPYRPRQPAAGMEGRHRIPRRPGTNREQHCRDVCGAWRQ